MGMFDYQDEIDPKNCENERENDWMDEVLNWNSVENDGGWKEAYDGFYYALTRKHRTSLCARLFHVYNSLKDAWEECATIVENDPSLETGWPYTKREEYIQDIYCCFRWMRNNVVDIKLADYPNDVKKIELLYRSIDLCKEIKEQVRELCILIQKIEDDSGFDLIKSLFALWNEVDDLLIELTSEKDDMDLIVEKAA